jgi:hypothetical protein
MLSFQSHSTGYSKSIIYTVDISFTTTMRCPSLARHTRGHWQADGAAIKLSEDKEEGSKSKHGNTMEVINGELVSRRHR